MVPRSINYVEEQRSNNARPLFQIALLDWSPRSKQRPLAASSLLLQRPIMSNHLDREPHTHPSSTLPHLDAYRFWSQHLKVTLHAPLCSGAKAAPSCVVSLHGVCCDLPRPVLPSPTTQCRGEPLTGWWNFPACSKMYCIISLTLDGDGRPTATKTPASIIFK